MGLAALHIAQGSDHPVFFYGQYYMGTPEAYLAAPLFRLFGPSVLAQRLPALLCYAAFLALAYQLTRRLYRPWLAVLVVGLLALGADRVIRDQLIAAGGYPEIMPLGAAILLLALLLATGLRRWRLAAFGGWGLLVGLVLWDDWLIAPYALAGAVLLVYGCRRELLRWPGLAVVVGAVVGALPVIYFNLREPGHNTLDAYLATSNGGPAQPLADRVHGAVSVGITLANGGCQPGRCGPAQQAASWVYLALLLISAGLAVAGLWRLRSLTRRPGPVAGPTVAAGASAGVSAGTSAGTSAGPTAGTVPDAQANAEAEAVAEAESIVGAQAAAGSAVAAGRAGVLLVARLCLAGAALLTIALYVRGPSAASAPLESARYLAVTQISLAAGAVAAVAAATPAAGGRGVGRPAGTGVRCGGADRRAGRWNGGRADRGAGHGRPGADGTPPGERARRQAARVGRDRRLQRLLDLQQAHLRHRRGRGVRRAGGLAAPRLRPVPAVPVPGRRRPQPGVRRPHR